MGEAALRKRLLGAPRGILEIGRGGEAGCGQANGLFGEGRGHDGLRVTVAQQPQGRQRFLGVRRALWRVSLSGRMSAPALEAKQMRGSRGS